MSISIQQAIDAIIAEIPGSPFGETVDLVKTGDPSHELSGAALTFMATSQVIERTVELGANLLITHEPTFYNHLDSTEWLHSHPVYQMKRELIEKNRLVIWRFHDYLHTLTPDPTIMGLVNELGWNELAAPGMPYVYQVSPMTLEKMVGWIKERTGAAAMRVVGDPGLLCKGVAVLPGFPPAEMQMEALANPQVNVLITGEVHEWETSEYARDANIFGLKKGLIVMGHQASEEPGMKWVKQWIEGRLPGVPVHFIPTGSTFGPK
jgi:putative NIF3 family GTP cyclohydrolase 1 type 2